MDEVVLIDKDDVVIAASTGPLDNAAADIADEVEAALREGAVELKIRVVV